MKTSGDSASVSGSGAVQSSSTLLEADRTAIARCLAGDADGFAELVDRYKGLVFSLARHSVGSADEAEDIAQETFIRAYSRLRHFRGEGNFRNWLCRIATRLCLDYHRARRPTESLEAAGFDPSGDPADSDLRQVVSQAIAELPPPYRIAIVLRHLEDLSYQEMADMLGLPVSTVKTHLLRARRRLRDRLGPALGMDRTRLEER